MEALSNFFLITMYAMVALGFLLILYLRRMYSKDSKKK
jgi:hypothetical protein